MLLRPGCCGAGGSWAVQHISGALWAPPGAGCRHLSSQHGIYWPVSGNHEPRTVAQWGGPGIKSMVMDTSRHPALLFQPCKLKPSVTVMAFWERGCAAPTGGDKAQASWHWAALPSPSTENKGVTFLQAELDTFMACLGLVFSHSSHFFFYPFPSGDLLICNRKVHCFPIWYFFDYLKRNPRGLFSQNSDCIIDVIMMSFAVSLQLGWLFWEALSTVSAAMCCACMAWAFIALHMCTRAF